jgi:hypothetical protein
MGFAKKLIVCGLNSLFILYLLYGIFKRDTLSIGMSMGFMFVWLILTAIFSSTNKIDLAADEKNDPAIYSAFSIANIIGLIVGGIALFFIK